MKPIKKISLLLLFVGLTAVTAATVTAQRDTRREIPAGSHAAEQTGQAGRMNFSTLTSLLPPVLGAYPNSPIASGGNATVTPSAVPTGAVQIIADAPPSFRGTFTVNLATGAVRVVNAQPEGVHTVTVTAFDALQATTTATFQLTVIRPPVASSAVTTANFAVATGSPFGVGLLPQRPQVGDFNNDGIADLVVANFNSDNVSLLTGNGTGGFNAAVTFATGGTDPQFIAVADYNGDGDQDFAVTNVTSNSFAVMLGDGAGSFAQASGSPFASGGSGPRDLTAGDFNGDGRVDLAIVTSSGAVVIRLGNGAGGFSAAAGSPYSIGANAFGLVKGFFNGDSAVDLAAVSINANSVRILTGNGAGGFTVGAPLTLSGSPRNGVAADFNSDGFQDLVFDSGGTNNLTVLLGDGTGAFAPATFVNVGFQSLGIATGDFNGDGKADLLVTENTSPGALALLLGTGTGTFNSGGTIAALTGPRGPAVADFNNDRRLDFVVPEGFGNRVSSYLSSYAFTTTAAGASISGRVLTGAGRGLANATVYLTDANGATRSTRTSSFGKYKFDDIAVGQMVTMSVASRRFGFAPQVINVVDSLTDVDFIGAGN